MLCTSLRWSLRSLARSKNIIIHGRIFRSLDMVIVIVISFVCFFTNLYVRLIRDVHRGYYSFFTIYLIRFVWFFIF
jgi:hypothetical protein